MTLQRKRLALVVAGSMLVATLNLAPMTHQAEANSGLPTTPVLSARRVPSLLLQTAREPALRRSLDGVVTQSPERTCLTVEAAGRSLFAHDPNLALAPASNQKLITAQLALDLLGASHRYVTRVVGDHVENGVVNGNLYLVGGGDPVLFTDAYRAHFGKPEPAATSLERLADKVAAAGVRHVQGSVVGDESRYDHQRVVPWWPGRYLEQHQLGPLSALEVNQSFREFPETFSEENLWALQAADDPARHAAQLFTELLRQRGVTVDGDPTEGVADTAASSVALIQSPKLSLIVEQMLSRSDNQIAELLVKEIGKAKGDAGSTKAGLSVMRGAVRKLGLPISGLVMRDGSGLDRDGRVSCAVIGALLEHTDSGAALVRGLAVGGRTGTLAKRFTAPNLKGRIRAKTGTLNDVTALSGFADTESGDTLTFSYIANGQLVTPDLLSIQDDLANALVGSPGQLRLSSLEPR